MNLVDLRTTPAAGITATLIPLAMPLQDGATVADVRIGLGYTLVELSDGRAGLAWTPQGGAASCTHLPRAGRLLGEDATTLLSWLAASGDLERAVGLATFNALNQRVDRGGLEEDAVDLLQLRPSDKVVMVGHFAPLLGKIRKSGCQLTVVEMRGGIPGTVDRDRGMSELRQCDVAIITSTSIINGTVSSLLAALGSCRSAVMLGPSTPLCPEAFAGTAITQLSGAYLLPDAGAAKEVVSQGGGTMILRPMLRFVSIPCPRG